MTSKPAEVGRVDFTGAIWFGAVLIGTGIPLAGLFAAGWRPAVLPGAARIFWWLGAGLSLAGLGCLAWAGCPLLGDDFEATYQQKSVCIRLGTVAAMVGFAVTTVVVLLSSAV